MPNNTSVSYTGRLAAVSAQASRRRWAMATHVMAAAIVLLSLTPVGSGTPVADARSAGEQCQGNTFVMWSEEPLTLDGLLAPSCGTGPRGMEIHAPAFTMTRRAVLQSSGPGAAMAAGRTECQTRSSVAALGRDGMAAGDIDIFSPQIVLSGTIVLGDGQDGQGQTIFAFPGCLSAVARGGDGGRSGMLHLHGHVRDHGVVVKGGKAGSGGCGTVAAAEGVDAGDGNTTFARGADGTTTSPNGQDANATTHDGGTSASHHGISGWIAQAQGGMGGEGALTGGKGGCAYARGGRGGPGGHVERLDQNPYGAQGGGAQATGGNGGLGGDQGGIGGDAIAEAGAGGPGGVIENRTYRFTSNDEMPTAADGGSGGAANAQGGYGGSGGRTGGTGGNATARGGAGGRGGDARIAGGRGGLGGAPGWATAVGGQGGSFEPYASVEPFGGQGGTARAYGGKAGDGGDGPARGGPAPSPDTARVNAKGGAGGAGVNGGAGGEASVVGSAGGTDGHIVSIAGGNPSESTAAPHTAAAGALPVVFLVCTLFAATKRRSREGAPNHRNA